MSWDCIIVGAGSAGCALAYELARSGQTVLVIEAGGSDWSPFIKVPAGVLRAGIKHNWGYRSQPDLSRNGATEEWIRGRVLGGCSSINGTMYVRGASEDFNRWNVPGWSAEEVMPVFREMECSDQPGPLRGHTGPLHVRTVRQPHAVTEAFIESACALGYAFNRDYNGRTQEGVSYAQLSLRGGFRCSAADAFLKPLVGTKNIKLLLNAQVERIDISNGRAVSVSFLRRGKRRCETARDFFLCAGAINSPKLLMLSGIGDARELSRHGIRISLDLPGVGRHLKEHPLLTLVYSSKVPTNNLTEGLRQKMKMASRFLIDGEGPISNLFEGAAYVKSTGAERAPNLQLMFMARGFEKGAAGDYTLTRYPSVAMHILASYPMSCGRISLSSHDPNAPPLIECRLLEEQSDIDTLAEGVKIVRHIMDTEPLNSIIDKEIVPGREIKSAQALQNYIRSHTGISYHPIGTCRMGQGADSVVDPNLKVHGIDNLWVADASIVPHPLSANMNAPCMMIGKKLGKQLTGSSAAADSSQANLIPPPDVARYAEL